MSTQKIIKSLYSVFNTRAAGVYILVFAAAIGTATFIENDFGTSAAQKVIYKSWWFEMLLILFGLTIFINIFKYRMLQQRKWPTFMFHFSILIILLGAAATRYVGYEGIMHIRQDESSNSFVSSNTYLQVDIQKNEKKYRVMDPVLFASLGKNTWEESFIVESDNIKIKLKEFIPNPTTILLPDPEGLPIYKVVMGGASGRKEYFIKSGERKNIQSVFFNFTEEYIQGSIHLGYRNDSMLIRSNQTLTQMTMATQQLDTLNSSQKFHPLKLRSLYSDGDNSFVFSEFRDKGTMQIVSGDRKVKNESRVALKMKVSVNGQEEETYVYGQKGVIGRSTTIESQNLKLNLSYGSKMIDLPFSIKLREFILEKYPGTNSASSYASEVTLQDEGKDVNMDYRIFMNNILKHDGYRFFQSSFDKDEQGTYLSVNHDSLGTNLSYLGYILLTIGMILALLNSKSRFIYLSNKVKKLQLDRKVVAIGIIISMFFSNGDALLGQSLPWEQNIVSQEHADLFSKVVVQDFKGRMKPMHTLSRELMRKIARMENLAGYNADQVILSMYANNRIWHEAPLIKVGKHEKLREMIRVEGDLAAYQDFFNEKGQYILRDEVRRAYGLQPIDRSMYEKELMKVDERVNIASMIFSGNIFKIIPIPTDENNTWVSNHRGEGDSKVANKFFEAYRPSLLEAQSTSNYYFPNLLINELRNYQLTKGAAVVPSEARIGGEILLNNLNVFNRLAVLYSLLGLAFLAMLFISIFRPSTRLRNFYRLAFGLMVVGFLFHTLGLGLRWYVSGRAPWSNGYESMIYIAWTSSLAGMLFTRKSLGGLAGTSVLASIILLVASLSYLDPEITPLVPVLRSYWLTIHVSLEAGSYGFLMLGAIIGLINLILMIFLTAKNKDRIKRIITEMSYISEMTLMGGLVMISIGTYLGGVWANESWGRYWGWDAKETWALVTILVYAFILHMRLIPKLGGLFAYNVASLFGWASVIMTYYGVNYYLSGLHSYAAGDPIPVPNWVYMCVVAMIVISLLAYWKKRKFAIL